MMRSKLIKPQPPGLKLNKSLVLPEYQEWYDGLISLVKFDEHGGNPKDMVRNRTWVWQGSGSAPWATNSLGPAVNADGAGSNYFQASVTSLAADLMPFTVACVLKPNVTTGLQVFLQADNFGNGLFFFRFNGNEIELVLNGGGGGSLGTLGIGTLTTDPWFVSCSYDENVAVYVVRNLHTGATFSSSAAQTETLSDGSAATWRTDGFQNWDGHHSLIYAAKKYSSVNQLCKLANNPFGLITYDDAYDDVGVAVSAPGGDTVIQIIGAGGLIGPGGLTSVHGGLAA